MVAVKGFRGIRYNEEKVADFSKVVAPPYDVIDANGQDELYNKSPLNVIRLILAKGEGDERYSNAKNTLDQWLSESVLLRDDAPSIYPYYQEFEFEGQVFRRKGFIAVVKIEEPDKKSIFAHERTFSKHKEDRLKLTDACTANLSQVFTVYSDKEGKVEDLIDENLGEPLVDVYNEENVRNTLWKISDKDILDKVTKAFKDKTLLIADGHHRYETALNYRNKRRAEDGNPVGEQPYDYVMMYISRGEGEGLIINPTHRVVKNTGGLSGQELTEKLKEYFEVREATFEEASNLKEDQIGVVLQDTGKSLVLTSKQKFDKEYNNIGVMLLHNIIFKNIIDEEKAEILYTKSADELKSLVENKDYKAGFILPKLKSDDIFDVVTDDTKMPHKTTYFYPKILSGLVFNPLW